MAERTPAQHEDEQTVLLVDAEDRFLGAYARRDEAHAGQGLRHRAFVCMLFDGAGRLLLQRRRHWLWDGLWDLSAVSHVLHLPDHDESYDEAAARTLKKELGIEGVPVRRIGGFDYYAPHPDGQGCENEYCAILFGSYVGPVLPNAEEVSAVQWVPFVAFVQELRESPERYTPWARLAVEALEREGKLAELLGADG
jgi:isopentenyl-diphosphate delta-isomerase